PTQPNQQTHHPPQHNKSTTLKTIPTASHSNFDFAQIKLASASASLSQLYLSEVIDTIITIATTGHKFTKQRLLRSIDRSSLCKK
ncbi:MAG: hypothetical protein ACK571_00675, partial [Pseudanabaena sp.]